MTDAYRAAAKTRAERHGFFAKSFEEEEDLRDYEAAVERSSQPSVPKRAMVGLGTVRLNRMVKWELAQGKPCALTTAAYNALGRAISDLPPAAAEGHQCLDDAAIYRQVQILLKDPELFLATLPKHLAEAVRKALHETPAPTVTTHGP